MVHLKRTRRSIGFTLIEMLVLIMIMAILAGIAAPAYARFLDRVRFDQNLQQVVGLLSWAKDTAVQTGGECLVEFESQSGVFVATPEQPATLTDQPAAFVDSDSQSTVTPPRQARLFDTVTVSDFVQFNSAGDFNTGGQSRIRFLPDGTCDGAAITLMSNLGYSALIEVSPMTGRIATEKSTPPQ